MDQEARLGEIKRNLRLMDREVGLAVKILQEKVRHGKAMLDIYQEALGKLWEE